MIWVAGLVRLPAICTSVAPLLAAFIAGLLDLACFLEAHPDYAACVGQIQLADMHLNPIGAPFPAIWDQLHAVHGPRDAARLFAKVLGELDTHGAGVVVPALCAALGAGTPLLLALTPARSLPCIAPDAVPAPLRDIEVGSGCAADYDAWLTEVAV